MTKRGDKASAPVLEDSTSGRPSRMSTRSGHNHGGPTAAWCTRSRTTGKPPVAGAPLVGRAAGVAKNHAAKVSATFSGTLSGGARPGPTQYPHFVVLFPRQRRRPGLSEARPISGRCRCLSGERTIPGLSIDQPGAIAIDPNRRPITRHPHAESDRCQGQRHLHRAYAYAPPFEYILKSRPTDGPTRAQGPGLMNRLLRDPGCRGSDQRGAARAWLGRRRAHTVEPSWADLEQFLAKVVVEPQSGVSIADGDTPFFSQKQLKEFYEVNVRQGQLIVNRVGSADDKWDAHTSSSNLTYCVSNTFGARYAAVVQAMATATGAWESAADVNFVYVSAQDGNCTAAQHHRGVRRATRSTSRQYIARAFFPSTAPPSRDVLIDSSAFAQHRRPHARRRPAPRAGPHPRLPPRAHPPRGRHLLRGQQLARADRLRLGVGDALPAVQRHQPGDLVLTSSTTRAPGRSTAPPASPAPTPPRARPPRRPRRPDSAPAHRATPPTLAEGATRPTARSPSPPARSSTW